MSIGLATLAALFVTENAFDARQTIPVDKVDFILHQGNDFCFVEVDSKTSASVIINFETRGHVGEFLVRKSGAEVDYSLVNPVTRVEKWIEAGVTKTQYFLSGKSGRHDYEGSLIVLQRAGTEDGMVLNMARDGKPIMYDCLSDFSEGPKK